MSWIRTGLALLATLGLCSDVAFAEWRFARGNAARTASSDLVMDFFVPAEAWRLYLGGTLAAHQLLEGPPDIIGEPTAILVAAGRIEARRRDDALLWSSTGGHVTRLLGRFDLDGDGAEELVACGSLPSGAAAALVFDAETGDLRWHSPAGDVGVLRDTARVADFDGDGLLDLYLADAGSNLPGSVSYGVHVYTFADGVAQGKKLWSMSNTPGRDYFASLNDAVGDFDGDGKLDVFAQGLKRVYIYSGQTGALIGASDPIGNMAAARSHVIVADLDGDGRDEAVTFAPGGWAPSINAVRVAVFGFDPAAQKPILLWERSAANPDTDAIAFSATSLADVDGVPGQEVVVAFAEPEWKTEILDAQTGQLKASISNRRFEANVDIDADGVAEILTHDRDTPIEIYAATGDAPNLLRTLDDRRLTTCAPTRASVHTALPALPCRPGGALLLGALDEEQQVKTLEVVDPSPDPALLVGSYALEGGLRFLTTTMWTQASGEARVVSTVSSGRMILFDPTLLPVNYHPNAEQPVLGIRVRNFDSGYGDLKRSPVAANLWESPGEELVFITSDARAIALNVAAAGPTGTPAPSWEAPRALSVVMGYGAEGAPRVVVAGKETLIGHDAKGNTLWSTKVFSPDDLKVRQYGDVITLDLDADGRDEVVTQARDYKNGEQRLIALDIDTGAIHFDTVVDTNNSGMRRLAGLDRADGGKDLIGGLPSAIWRFDGLTGAPTVVTEAALGVYGIGVDLDGDGGDEILAVNRESLGVYQKSGKPVWTSDTPLLKPVLGTVISCQGTKHLVAPYARGTALWQRDLLTGEIVWERTLAGGEAFETPDAAIAFGETPAILGNVASARLENGEYAALVGSGTGWLYAIHGCTGTLLWSLPLGRPLREIVVADWDGDGRAEIVARATDGTVSGVDREAMQPVAQVRDTDPPRDVLFADVDDIETFDTLYAVWEPVDGAIGYRYTVFTVDGQEVTSGFTVVGVVESATISDLPLLLGVRYVVSVSAQGPEGWSAARASDGVTVVDISPPEATLSPHQPTVSPGGTVDLSYNITDRTRLQRVEIQLLTKAFDLVRVVHAEEALDTASLIGTIAFNAVDAQDAPLVEKGYILRLVARDWAAHETVVDAPIEVDATSITADADPAERSEAEGMSGDPEEGCTCHSARPPSPWLALGLALFFVDYRRRRRKELFSRRLSPRSTRV